MSATLQKKLRISSGQRLIGLHAPKDFAQALAPLPEGTTFSSRLSKQADALHWFVRDRKQLAADLPKVKGLLRPGLLIWCYYPKGTSGVQTDLTRDKGWDQLLKLELRWLVLVSFDDTWSAFALRAGDGKRAGIRAERGPREIDRYADPATKSVRIPEALALHFAKNKRAAAVFQALSYSHRREYVEWIVSAKKEETRSSRAAATVERLLRGSKNPRNL